MRHSIKKIVKRIPFYYQVDFVRRRIYEAKIFDFRVNKLAHALEHYPVGLIIDTTNRCNAQCVWCPHPAARPQPQEMDDHLYKKILKDFSCRRGTIKFGNYGEPLLDKKFLERIEFLRNCKNIVLVDMNTNISLLSKDIAAELIRLNVHLELSLDELERDIYQTVKGLDYERVMGNLFDVLHLNREAKKPVRIIVKIKTLQSYREIYNNPLYGEIKNLLTTGFIELLPIAEEDPINRMGGSFDKDKFEKLFIKKKKVKNNYRRYNLLNPSPCAALWRYMVIVPNGNVVQCCIDVNQSVVLGNLAHQSLEEIWRGNIITELREKAINRERKKMVLCRNCDLHQGWQYLRRYYALSDNLIKDPFLR